MIVLYAELAQAAAPTSTGLAGILFEVVAILGVFYFVWLRPQQRERKKHEDGLRALKKGDEIVTTGGIVGKVVFIKETLKDGEPVRAMDDRVTIDSGDSRLIVERGRIARVGSGQPATPST